MLIHIQNVFKKYAVFSGRAQRAEYWYFTLFNITLTFLVSLVVGTISENLAGILTGLYGLAVVIPGIAVAVRRLHDTNRSGWWIFISFIPLVGTIWLLVLMVLDSTPGDNRFGPNPEEVAIVQPVEAETSGLDTPTS